MLNIFEGKITQAPYLRRRGFAILEAMIAVAILSIGIIGVYKLQVHSISGNAFSNRLSSSAVWAAYIVERLVALDYDSSALQETQLGSYAGSAGLNATGANADRVFYVRQNGSIGETASADPTNDVYSVFWNIAEGTETETNVLIDVKQVRVIINKNTGSDSGIVYSQDYFKAKGL